MALWPFPVAGWVVLEGVLIVGGMGEKGGRAGVLSEALQLLCCSPIIYHMDKTPKTVKLSRRQLQDALQTMPASVILGREVNRELTPKQRKFALEVAKGNTKAEAYRKAYNVKSKNTMAHAPYRLSRDDRIKHEIEAIEAALRAQEYQTPAALRALVVQSLVQVITDPDSKPGQITAAAKVLGTVTEVAAFTERKEVRTISSSEDARARIMAELRELVKAQAEDADVIDAAADSLLAELAPIESNDADADETVSISGKDEPHHPGTPHAEDRSPAGRLHINPHEQTPISSDPHEHTPHSSNFSSPDPTPSPQEDPPVDGT